MNILKCGILVNYKVNTLSCAFQFLRRNANLQVLCFEQFSLCQVNQEFTKKIMLYGQLGNIKHISNVLYIFNIQKVFSVCQVNLEISNNIRVIDVSFIKTVILLLLIIEKKYNSTLYKKFQGHSTNSRKVRSLICLKI